MVNWLYLHVTVFDNGNATGFDKLKYQKKRIFCVFYFNEKIIFN